MGETDGLVVEACRSGAPADRGSAMRQRLGRGAEDAVADVAALLGDLPQLPPAGYLEPARVRWRALGREGQAAGANADDEVEQAGHQVGGGLLEGVALPGGEADQ